MKWKGLFKEIKFKQRLEKLYSSVAGYGIMTVCFYKMRRKTHPSAAWRGWMAWEVFTFVIRGASGAFFGAALAFFSKEATLLPSGFQLIIQTS
jgi:purine-cytosine permease-like protein